MSPDDKPLVWLKNEVKSPPFSQKARLEAGYLLRRLQKGESLSEPHSSPMPTIGPGCHEIKIKDKKLWHRIIYKIYADSILIVHIFQKKTDKTPQSAIDLCKERIKKYELAQKWLANKGFFISRWRQEQKGGWALWIP